MGTAIIRRDRLGDAAVDEVCDNWYHYRHQPLEEQIEMAVSRYIGVMPSLWLDVSDRATRQDIEAGAIGLLSLRTGGTDPPSPGWLGRHALKTEIQDSGLWNVQLTKGATMRAFWISWLLACIRLGKRRMPTQRIPRSCRISSRE